MTVRSHLFLRPRMGIVWMAVICGLFVSVSLALGGRSQNGTAQFHIALQNGQGKLLAGASSSKAGSKVLTFDREYQPGDRLVLSGPRRMAVRVDGTLPECLLYVPDSTEGEFIYEIPYGREEKQTGSAYAAEMFAGESHRIELRAMNKGELTGYRNLALNPCDLPRAEQAAVQYFPHASSNSVSRSLFDFEARNAIDGFSQNGHHGVWPYQSWGPQLRTDIWWKVDFGRAVELDKVRLMVRADFPHDSYWKSADVEFSDGSHVPLKIAKSAEFQDFYFSKRTVSWLRINNVMPADPTKWCSFIEVEAWGRDLP
jgi:hypothetical protein